MKEKLVVSEERRICSRLVLAAARRPAAVVWGRRWVSPSLRRFCLHSSLFPKKRRGELGPGRRAAAIIGKLAEVPLSRTQSAPEASSTWAFSVALGTYLSPNAAAIAANRCLACATPALRYVATTMDRIIIAKATWWRRRLSRFFLHARISSEGKKRSLAWTAADCSSTWNIYFYLSRVLLQRKRRC